MGGATMNVNFIKAYTRDGTTAAHALTLESLGDGGICEDGRWLMLSSAYKVYWSGGGELRSLQVL